MSFFLHVPAPAMSLRVAICLLAVLRAAQCDSLDSWHKVHFKKIDALAARAVASIKGHEGYAAADNESDLFAEQGFWFSHFAIGASQDLEMLIDTGSSDVVLNPGVYRPSPSSQDTGRPFEISYATTNPDGSGRLTASGQVYRDVVSQHGAASRADLAVNQQALGDIRKPTTPPTFPRDGLIGYADRGSALGASSFIHSLCDQGDQGSLSSCRFGLALKTDRTGELHYGAVPADLFAGSLATVPIQGEWAVSGALTLNGKTVWADVKLITDSGTTVIFGPTEQVSHLFQKAGIEAARTPNGITGYYKCSAPPNIGFSLGGRNFNVLPEALAFAKMGDNCTTSVRGSGAFGNNWLVGQPFFQGRYIDHSIRDGTMGFADLK